MAKLGALVGAVTGHGDVWKRSEVCKVKDKEKMSNVETTTADE